MYNFPLNDTSAETTKVAVKVSFENEEQMNILSLSDGLIPPCLCNLPSHSLSASYDALNSVPKSREMVGLAERHPRACEIRCGGMKGFPSFLANRIRVVCSCFTGNSGRHICSSFSSSFARLESIPQEGGFAKKQIFRYLFIYRCTIHKNPDIPLKTPKS